MIGVTQGRIYEAPKPMPAPPLAACPFCGGEAKTIDLGPCGRNWAVICEQCDCVGPKPPHAHPSEAAAAIAWNARAALSCGSNSYEDSIF